MALLRVVDRRHARPSMNALNAPLFDELERVLQRVGATDAVAELAELRARLAPDDRGERGGPPNAPRRR